MVHFKNARSDIITNNYISSDLPIVYRTVIDCVKIGDKKPLKTSSPKDARYEAICCLTINIYVG